MVPLHQIHAGGRELRQDLVTGKWVVIAGARAGRPRDVAATMAPHGEVPAYVERCPFCNLEQFPQAPDTAVLPRRGSAWRVRAFPNKFPAFVPRDHARGWHVGPYRALEAVGFHEVMIAREHNGFLASLSPKDAQLTVRLWRDRYRDLMRKPSVAYIQIIENHGKGSGGSLEHSHAQLFAIPVLPSDEVLDLLEGAERYFRETSSCAYCDIMAFERAEATRLLYENDRFTVVTPFAPRTAYEQWVLPKSHASGFETLGDDDIQDFADAVQAATGALAEGFHDPPYTLYLYSAPCDTEGFVCDVNAYTHFHWHAQILPRMNVWGGFELATGMEIVSTPPEEGAAFLREHYASHRSPRA